VRIVFGLFAISAFLSSPPDTGAPPAQRALETLPNTSIEYYDVAGNSLLQVNGAIAARSKEAGKSGTGSASAADWDLTVSFEQTMTAGKCRITAAHATFRGTVVLPRLVNRNSLPREQLKLWDKYIAALKANEADELWFVYDRLPSIEQAVLAGNCKTAGRAAAAAAEQLRQQAAEFARRNHRQPPTFRYPVHDPNDPRS
jgi:predicted secreted Zn-dependent protease